MIYKEFGKTGLKASVLGFGAMRLPMVEIGGKKKGKQADACVECGQ